MKKFLLPLLSLLTLPAMSQTFAYEGVIYQVYDPGFLTCIVAEGDNTVNYIDGDLVIPETVMYNNEEYTVIGIGQYSFYYGDEYYQQPWTLTLPNTIVFINDGAFWHCEYLTDIKFSTSLTNINESAFSHCYSLGNVTLPSSLTYVGDWAFYSNHSMTEIILPPNLTATGMYAFCGPRGDNGDLYNGGVVEKIYIPSGFDELNKRAFGYQPELKEVHCYATVPPVLTSAPFNHSTTEESTLYVPADAVNSYKTDETWMRWEWVSVEAGSPEYPWKWEDTPDAGVELTPADNGPAKYFDLHGRSVGANNLKPGIYVVRQGNKNYKTIIR